MDQGGLTALGRRQAAPVRPGRAGGGRQLTTKTLIKNGAGDLFGIITAQSGDGLIIANDGTNALDEFNM